MEDVFEENRPVYTFENRCLENQELPLQDGTQKIFLNAAAVDGAYGEQMSPKLRSFLRYLITKCPQDDFTGRLEKKVEKAKQDAEWRREYMKLELKLNEMREEGRIEGRIEGQREGEIKGRREGQSWILISLIKKKLVARKDIEQIAEEVEESIETIRPIVEILQEHPDYDAEMVYNSLPVTV